MRRSYKRPTLHRRGRITAVTRGNEIVVTDGANFH
jgi:hypothetical protein